MWVLPQALWLFLSLGADPAQRGHELYKESRYSEAIQAAQEAIRTQDPSSATYKDLALVIGQSYFMLGQAPKAIPWLEKLPASNEANYMLGYAHLQTNQPGLAEAAFARLFGLDPASAAGHLLAGQMMLKKAYHEDAVREVNRALELDPKLPQAHFLLGEVAIFRGRFDEGIEQLREELALNPNLAAAWYRLGDAYVRKENWDEAIPDLQRAVWLNPEFSGPYILLGKCYFKTANYGNAEGILKRALAIDPQNHAATYLLGQTLVAAGKKEEGRALFEKLKSMPER
jgi:tetratricopeptide (TPR) repeat protein